MSLYEQILADLKKAMLAKDKDLTQVLRSMKAALLEKEISERKGGEAKLSEEQVVQVLMKAAKQRKDSIEQYDAAGRTDLSETEKKELAIIESYLPKMMSKEEVASIVDDVISNTGAKSMQDMGKVMGAIMPRVKGKADGSLVNQIVKEKLSHG